MSIEYKASIIGWHNPAGRAFRCAPRRSRSETPCLLISLLGALAIVLSSTTFAEDIYIAQTAQGSDTGANAANAHSAAWFNTSGNWGAGAGKIGPGDTAHLCGTITSELTAQASGSSGSPITILFEPNSRISMPVSDSSGCLNVNGLSWLVVDGGTNGIIENTQNGTGLAHQQSACVGISAMSCGNCEFRNLHIQNLYVHTSVNDYVIDHWQNNGIHFNGSNILIHDNVMHDVGICLNFAYGDGDNNVQMYNNDIYNIDHGLAIGGWATTIAAHNIRFYNNHVHDYANWDTVNDSYHHDGIHAYATPPAASTDVWIYDNVFDGDTGENITAHIFMEGGSGAGATPWTTSSGSARIFNNIFVSRTSNPVYCGLLCYNCGTGSEIYNNTFMGQKGNGGLLVTLGDASNLSFRNNVLTSNDTLISVKNATFAAGHFDNNVYSDIGGYNGFVWNQSLYTSDFLAWKSASQGDANSLNPASAGLDNAGHIQAGSAVIGAGANLTSAGIALLDSDIAGHARPASGTWDIGAYSYQASGNQSPACSITSPAPAADFTAPANITINANASDSDGSVTNVEFYQGAIKIGSDATAPYSCTWTNVTAGSYSLTVKAYDNLGASTVSVPVGITVSTPSLGDYYVDYASGSDANNGTSKTTPWKRAPGMAGFSGNYAHKAGDVFVLKGGVTWAAAALPITVGYSGSAGNVDTYTTDHTWYSGGSWSQPVLDGGNTKAQGIVANSKSYFKFDDLKIQNIYDGSGHDSKVIESANCHHQEFSRLTTIGGTWITFFIYSTTVGTLSNYVIHDCDISSAAMGIVVATSQGGAIISDVQVYNNRIHDFAPRLLYGDHGDGIHMWGVENDTSQYLDNVKIYNNVFDGDWDGDAQTSTTAPINMENGANNVYIYNNIFDTSAFASGGRMLWDDGCIYIDSKGCQSSNVNIEQNTFNLNASVVSYAIQIGSGANPGYVRNNVAKMTGTDFNQGIYVRNPSTGITVDYNCWVGFEEPGSLDYTAQDWTAWRALGFDTHSTSENPNWDSTYRLTTGSQTGSGHVRDGGYALGSPYNVDKDGVSRPQGSGWDMGAYEYNSGGPVTPVISSATTATGTVGQAFSYQIGATGNPTNYSVTGTLPAGLAVNQASGLISGIPTTVSTNSVTIGAMNAAGAGTATLVITISVGSTGPSGLVGWWKLDESSGTTAADSSGNGNTGTLSGGTWQSAGGQIAGALHLNAFDVVNCGAAASLSTPSVTVAFWMKPDSVGNVIPVDKLPPTGSVGYAVKLRDNGSIWFRVGAESGPALDVYGANGIYTNGVWTHVACTFDAGTGNMKMYINGIVESHQPTYAVTLNASNTTFRMGSTLEQYAGLLDDVRVYDHALTAGEIATVMAGGGSVADVIRFVPAGMSTGPTGCSFSWSGSTGATNSFKVYRSTNLFAGSWQLVAPNIARSGTGTNLWTDTNVFQQAFYRVTTPN